MIGDLPASAETASCFCLYRSISMARFGFGKCDRHHGFTLRISIIFWTRGDARPGSCADRAVTFSRSSWERARNCDVLILVLAVQGDVRFSDAHASQHCGICHNGSIGFGGNAYSAETADPKRGNSPIRKWIPSEWGAPFILIC